MAHHTMQRLDLWLRGLWNDRRESVIDELFDRDSSFEMAGPTERLDRNGFRGHWRALLMGFPNLRFEVLSMLGDEGTGSVHWRARGSHDASWRGIPGTHQAVEFTGVSILHFHGSHAIQVHDLWDRVALTNKLHQAHLVDLAQTYSLTQRQYEVARLMADRLTHVEIAYCLGISPNTARRHGEAVMLKLGVHRRTEVLKVLRSGRTSESKWTMADGSLPSALPWIRTLNPQTTTATAFGPREGTSSNVGA